MPIKPWQTFENLRPFHGSLYANGYADVYVHSLRPLLDLDAHSPASTAKYIDQRLRGFPRYRNLNLYPEPFTVEIGVYKLEDCMLFVHAIPVAHVDWGLLCLYVRHVAATSPEICLHFDSRFKIFNWGHMVVEPFRQSPMISKTMG